jgi:Peptidase A4 family
VVKPGDQITVTTSFTDDQFVFTFVINDRQTEYSATCATTCQRDSAEVITEDPGGGTPNGVYLPNYGNVEYSGIEIDGQALSSFNPQELDMGDANDQAMVSPSPIGADGASFSTPFTRGS